MCVVNCYFWLLKISHTNSFLFRILANVSRFIDKSSKFKTCCAAVVLSSSLCCCGRYMRCRRYSKRYTLAMTTPSRELPEDIQRSLACNPIRHSRAGSLYCSRDRPSKLQHSLTVHLTLYDDSISDSFQSVCCIFFVHFFYIINVLFIVNKSAFKTQLTQVALRHGPTTQK